MRQELLRSVYTESCDRVDIRNSAKPHRDVAEKEHNRRGVDAGEVSMSPPSIAAPKAKTNDERRSPRRASRSWGASVAALIATLVIGLLSGFVWQGVGFANETSLLDGPTAIQEHWLHEVADYYLIYAEDDLRVVELGPERKDLLEKWVGKRIGRHLPVADLSRFGTRFKGGRMIPLEGQAAALFVYQAEGGELFSVCITRAWSQGERERIAAHKSGLGVVYWSHAGLVFVVMGNIGPALLDNIARDLEKHFDKV
jgi:anti-sigma factor RsiW